MDEFTKKPATIEDVAKNRRRVHRHCQPRHFQARKSCRNHQEKSDERHSSHGLHRQCHGAKPAQTTLTNGFSIDPIYRRFKFFQACLLASKKPPTNAAMGVLIGNTDSDAELEAKYLRFLSTGIADGMILLTGHLPVAGWPRSQVSTFPPMVTAMRPIDHSEINYVGVDDLTSYKMATEYLVLPRPSRHCLYCRPPRRYNFRTAL